MIAKRLGSASAAWIDARRAKAEVASVFIEAMVAEVLIVGQPYQGIRRNTPASGSSLIHHCVGTRSLWPPRFVSRAAMEPA